MKTFIFISRLGSNFVKKKQKDTSVKQTISSK